MPKQTAPHCRRAWLLMAAMMFLAGHTDPAFPEQRSKDQPEHVEALEQFSTPRLRILSGPRAHTAGIGGSSAAVQTLAVSTSEYQTTVIEPLPGRDRSRALGINNYGHVVGRSHNYDSVSETDVDRQAFIWDSVNGAQILGTLSGESGAWGINDNGQASGFSYNASGFRHAVRWDTTVLPFSVLDIGTLTNDITGVSGDTSTAYDLNNLGQVTGYSDIPNDAGDFVPFHAFVFDEVNGIQDLGTFDTQYPQYQFGYSIAYDVNGNEQVVGLANSTDTGAWEFRPFIYDAVNGLRELNRDFAYGPNEWYAVAMNDSGLIAGHVIAAADQSLPYYWEDETSDPIQISMPAAFPYGEIYGMNADGMMVGIMWDDLGVEHGFIFDTTNGVRDLNELIDPASGWVVQFARDINDAGQIVGTGEWNGLIRGFVLSPSALVMGRISGVIRDGSLETPLAGVQVDIYDSSGAWVTEEFSDETGNYTTALLTPDTYYVATQNNLGYVDELFNGILCTGCDPLIGTPVTVNAGSNTDGVDFALGHSQLPAATVYDDGEDGMTDGWSVYDNDPAGATTANVYDSSRQSQVIELSGSGTANGYELRNEDGSYWNNTTQFVIQWSMAYTETFTVYIDVETTAGQRFLYYTPEDMDRLGSGRYVHHGLGSSITDGQWHTFVRDLRVDLANAQPGATILEVDRFLIRGSGRVDDVILWSDAPPLIYEDGEDELMDGWRVYDDDPPGATIANVFDSVRQSRVIDVFGSGTANGYELREENGALWHNSSQFIIEWALAYSENFTVYVDVDTTAGQRFLYYTPEDTNRLGTGLYVHHGLGTTANDGNWSTFIRDLRVDLEDAQPGVTVLEVNRFLIRGSGRIDDVKLWSTMPVATYEDGEDGTIASWLIYDDDPAGATVLNVYDGTRQSQVIELSGSGTANGYRLLGDSGGKWHNTDRFIIEWSMAYSESFTVYVDVETTAGQRFLYYTPEDINRLGAARYIHHGVGSTITDGLWRTLDRDLQADLEEAQPGAAIVEVNGFLIRGSGRVDDIRLRYR